MKELQNLRADRRGTGDRRTQPSAERGPHQPESQIGMHTAPVPATARSQTVHSGRIAAGGATRSPGPMPRRRRPSASSAMVAVTTGR
jgi:hypothetical protein